MQTPISLAITVFLAVVMAGRWVLVNELTSDRLLNRAFGWNLGGMVVWGVVAAAGSITLGERLYLAVAVLGVANIFGLARLLDGADPEGVWSRQRRYDAIAVTVSVVTVLCLLVLPADRRDFVLGILWATSNLALGVATLLVARVAFREVRTRSRTTRQRLAYGLLFGVCVYSAVAAPIGALGVLGLLDVAGVVGGQRPGEISDTWVGSSFLTLGAITGVLAIPLVRAVLIRTGWDSAGRGCRRLHPLWSDLTAAVPEVVLAPDGAQRADSELRLYRMTVEIRDALVHLKPYAPGGGEQDAAGYARRIAQALHAKTIGAAPIASHPATASELPADRTAELHRLFELARAWSPARAAISTAALPR
ncbi:MAB_1171c family putative transporter [Nocardia sp. NPDC050712]|uniref:MAB_1171c family putative transporter n=1 Tax=Nocardia sp. NPDC050712 TaxID=3155518 RepID=UPI0033FA69EC